jgi:acetyl-CoA carboxylase biotin carboxyl carrier protein
MRRWRDAPFFQACAPRLPLPSIPEFRLTKSGELTLDLKQIKELIALMRKNDLSVFKMENEGFKITLKRGTDFQPVISTTPVAAPVAMVAPSSASAAVPAAAPAEDPVSKKEIVSPMVGTFYRSASPDAASFVEVGTEVTPDMVVCIIEAMKVMNEIKAEMSGTVTEILAENSKPVQFGQPLFRLK